MKIATMVRGYIPAPCSNDIVYAPIDLAAAVSDGLAKLGHKVTYYGPLGTRLESATVENLNMRPLVHNQQEFQALMEDTDLLTHDIPGLWDHFMARDMFERAARGEFDLLHFHHPETAMPFAKLYPQVPVVYTLHDPVSPLTRELMERYLTPNQSFISISNNQRLPAPDLPYTATVYNGIEMDQFAFEEEHEDYLLFVGRMVPQKGIEDAIRVAQQTNNRLLLIGPSYNQDREYFDTRIKPHLNDKILYLGFIERDKVVCYYQKAKALLMPIQWEEPFGLSMIEAMACGTPVIAMRRGSVPEVVADGVSGIIVNSIAEMVDAVGALGTIKATDCRAHVEENFSSQKMVQGYETAFKFILGQHLPASKRGMRIKDKLPASILRAGKKATKFIKQG